MDFRGGGVRRGSGIFSRLSALGDPLRVRILLLLERHELTVAELCAILQSPQPTVSRHLKALSADGWIAARADGTHRRYALKEGALDGTRRALWLLVRRETSESAAAAQDAKRLRNVLDARRAGSKRFFSSSAGRWDATRDDLFGPGFLSPALLGLLDPEWVVGDLGCGTGPVSEVLAPLVSRVIAVDESQSMLRAAERRLAAVRNVEFRFGGLESLPVEDDGLDAATLVLVLHHVAEPSRALREVARALKPGGRLLVVDMLPHDREEYRRTMGHVWLGFDEIQLTRLFAEAGLSPAGVHPVPPHPKAKGPALFAARALRPRVFSQPAARAALPEGSLTPA